MMKREKQKADKNTKRVQQFVVLLFFCLLSGYFITSCTSTIQEKPKPESPFKPLPEEVVSTDTMEDVDFSKFDHNGERHKTVPCLLCHQRNEESPKPRFSSHATCTGCHTQQFKDENHPICSICHTGPNTAELKPFPPMQSFRAHFDHAQHVRQTNCATCHKTEGVGMTVPVRAAAHETCFQCHTSDKVVGDKNIGSCSTCHEPGPANRISDAATNVGFNFSHSKHSRVDCASCHNAGGSTQIKVGMHSGAANSCATCHNEKRAFGANDFSDCRKCHTEVSGIRSFGIKFNHAQHTKSDCATCHKSGAGGVNFNVPNSEAAHKTCFQCHSPMQGKGSFTNSKCFTCHQPGSGNNLTPSRSFIPGNFSHTKHSFFDCANCHTTTGGKMDVPSVVMHKPSKSKISCVGCHDNQTAFGEDFTNCKRCHTGGNFKFKK
jgi:hypothetical protein